MACWRFPSGPLCLYDSLGQDRAQLSCSLSTGNTDEGHGKVFVPVWHNEGLGTCLIFHPAMKARGWTPEEDWSCKGSPGRDDPFQADAGMLLVFREQSSPLLPSAGLFTWLIISDSDFPSRDSQCI